jgi:hypothetical protein
MDTLKHLKRIESVVKEAIEMGVVIWELSIFGVDIRYPDDFYIPAIEEVKFYYNLTKQIKILVNSKLEMKEY